MTKRNAGSHEYVTQLVCHGVSSAGACLVELKEATAEQVEAALDDVLLEMKAPAMHLCLLQSDDKTLCKELRDAAKENADKAIFFCAIESFRRNVQKHTPMACNTTDQFFKDHFKVFHHCPSKP